MKAKIRTTERIFMVYGLRKNPPTVPHFTAIKARNEAERLAVQNPGIPFYVLESVCAVFAPIPKAQEVELVQGVEIPF